MNVKTEILHFNNINEEKLGIKILFAKDTEKQKGFAIIADVNPAGYCYSKSISPGDILLSVNGSDINTWHTYKDISENNQPINQITIMKYGIIDGSDLFKRCSNTPCTAFCKTWNDTPAKLTIPGSAIDRQCHALSDSVIILKPAKQSKFEEPTIKDPTVVPDSFSKQFIPNTPKIKFHHKIIQNLKNKNIPGLNDTSNANYNLKPSKPLTKNVKSSFIPHFIKREDYRFHDLDISTHIKEARSLDNITDLTDDYQLLGSVSPSYISKVSNKSILLKSKLSERRRSFESTQEHLTMNDTELNNGKDKSSFINNVSIDFQELKEIHRIISQKNT